MADRSGPEVADTGSPTYVIARPSLRGRRGGVPGSAEEQTHFRRRRKTMDGNSVVARIAPEILVRGVDLPTQFVVGVVCEGDLGEHLAACNESGSFLLRRIRPDVEPPQVPPAFDAGHEFVKTNELPFQLLIAACGRTC